jgi:hypothetical protein
LEKPPLSWTLGGKDECRGDLSKTKSRLEVLSVDGAVLGLSIVQTGHGTEVLGGEEAEAIELFGVRVVVAHWR